MGIKNLQSNQRARELFGIAPVGAPPSPPSAPCADFSLRPTTDVEKLNKTERSFLDLLREREQRGIIEQIGVQDMTLKLADDCRYTPDFRAVVDRRLTFYETKGFFRDDAKVKLKVAARQFRWARFVLVTKEKQGWIETEINA